MEVIDVVCGIIQQKNTYLIAKRNSEVHNHKWEFPGGKVENEETREEALIREMKEELGIDIQIIRYVTMIEDKRSTCLLRVYAYLCHIKYGEVQLHAHHEVRYVTAAELFAYDFEEADFHILDMLQEAH